MFQNRSIKVGAVKTPSLNVRRDIEALQQIIGERGYLVILSDLPLQIGEQFSHLGHVEQPFVVLSETDEADAEEQRRWLLRKRGKPFVFVADPALFYYRVVTD